MYQKSSHRNQRFFSCFCRWCKKLCSGTRDVKTLFHFVCVLFYCSSISESENLHGTQDTENVNERVSRVKCHSIHCKKNVLMGSLIYRVNTAANTDYGVIEWQQPEPWQDNVYQWPKRDFSPHHRMAITPL